MIADTLSHLYWSARGTVLCTEHVRDLDAVRWRVELWAPIPESSQGRRGIWYQCQRCSPDGVAIRKLRTPTPCIGRLRPGTRCDGPERRLH
jgi:hypothetical protein